MQYDALLPDDPKRVLSHKYQVCHPILLSLLQFQGLINEQPGCEDQCNYNFTLPTRVDFPRFRVRSRSILHPDCTFEYFRYPFGIILQSAVGAHRSRSRARDFDYETDCGE